MTPSQRQAALLFVATLGVTGAMVTAQAIFARHAWRLDLTPGKRYVLSAHAKKILANLDRDIRITAFLRSEDPRNKDIEDLLRRLSLATPRVRYRVIDVNRNPALARQYQVSAYGAVVVESGKRRKQFTNPNEPLLMAAIVQVTRAGRQRVYFLTGHGEHGIHDRSREGGYSSARIALRQELYDVEEINLLGGAPVPGDAAALVVAGPRSALLPMELLRVDEYVRRGGSLLVLSDPGTTAGLEAVLERYGLILPNEVVLDPANRQFAGDLLTMQIPVLSPFHPVSSALREPPLMSRIRPVEAKPVPAAISAVEMLRSGPEGRRTTDLGALRGKRVHVEPGRGKPIPVGASALVRNPAGPPGRVIVFGDSDFADNSFLAYLGNRDLFLNSVNWLAGEVTLISSRPAVKEMGTQQFFLTARQGRSLFWIGAIVQPACILAIGIVVFLRRQWRG